MQLEFRAWDIDLKKFVNAPFKNQDNGTLYALGSKQDCILEQFTGLHDDEGIKIFEGDILKLCADDMGEIQEWTAVVEFGNPNGFYDWGFQLKPIDDKGVNPEILLWVETELSHVSCKIIGNIHQNPELVG